MRGSLGREALDQPRQHLARADLIELVDAVSDPEAIRQNLVKQVTGAVRWRESVAYMAAHGVDRFFEIGAGKVLSGLVKRLAPEASAQNFGAPADIEAYKAARQTP